VRKEPVPSTYLHRTPGGAILPRMLTGGCLCGGVRFDVAGEVGSPTFCHCSLCRRASGSAFAVNAGISSADFRLRAGADLVREYESSPGHFRAFCSHCGSPIYSRLHEHPEFRRIRLGTLDQDPGVRPLLHVWVGSKAPWFTITDRLPQLEEGDAG